MSQLEILREKLHLVMDSGDADYVLQVSQELDELILHFMQIQRNSKKMSA